MVQVTITP